MMMSSAARRTGLSAALPLLIAALVVVTGVPGDAGAAEPKVRQNGNPTCNSNCKRDNGTSPCSGGAGSWKCYRYEVCPEDNDIKDFHVHVGGSSSVEEGDVEPYVCFQEKPSGWLTDLNRDDDANFHATWNAGVGSALSQTSCGSGWTGAHTSFVVCADYGSTNAVSEGDPPGDFGSDGSTIYHEPDEDGTTTNGEVHTQDSIGTDSGPTFNPSSPSLTTWGLVTLVLLMLASIAWVLRRRGGAEGSTAA